MFRTSPRNSRISARPSVIALRHSPELGGMGKAADYFTPLLEVCCGLSGVVPLSARRADSDHFGASLPAKIRTTARAVLRYSRLTLTRSPDFVYLPISQWGVPLLRDAFFVALARAADCVPVIHLHGAQLPARLSSGRVLRAALGGAHWIVLSEDVATQLRSSGCRTRSVTVVRNPAPPAIAARRAGRPGVLRVGWVGTMCRAKGFDLLCAAVAGLKSRGARLDFRVAGMRLDVPVSETAGVDADLGVLGPKEVTSFWAEVDVFVLPARWLEGLPFVLLEALQSQCAVATTRSPGCAELLAAGCVDEVASTVASVTGFLEECRADLEGVRRRQQKGWRELRRLYEPGAVEEAFLGFWRNAGSEGRR